MRALPYLQTPDRRRILAFVLALAFEVLFLLAFFVPFSPLVRKTSPALKVIAILPESTTSSSTRSPEKAEKRAVKSPPPPRPAPPPIIPPLPTKSAWVELTPKDLSAGDISKVPNRKAERAGEGETGLADSGTAMGPGEGPNGAPLYNAEWYVEPKPSELALYLPPGGPKPGWALIMCQTAPAYRVENCRSLSESPPGSRLANALRQAAWQFKVRPPRRGGQPLIGAWVKIRFDWIERGER
jgi:protein TonB